MRNLDLDFFLLSRLGLLLVLVSGILQLMFQPVFGKSGQYLVATQATRNNDFEIASDNYVSILKRGISETIIYQEALLFSRASQMIPMSNREFNCSDAIGCGLILVLKRAENEVCPILNFGARSSFLLFNHTDKSQVASHQH